MLPHRPVYKYLLFLLIFLFKLLQAYYFSKLTECANPERALGVLAISSGDTFSYTGAMENYVQAGAYFFDNGREKVHAGRLPHYSLPYWFFRQFLSPSASYDVVVVFQVMVESLAIVCFGLVLIHLSLSNAVYWTGIGLLTFSANFSHSANYISPESLTSSLLVVLIYFYFRYLQNENTSNLLATGLILSLLVCLKPYLILLFIPVGIQFLYREYKKNHWYSWMTQVLRKTGIVSIPLILLLTPWTIRNYFVYNQLVPLQINTTAGYNYTKADFAYRKFLQAWGGDIIFWEKSAAGCYFIASAQTTCEFQFPEYAFTKGYTIDDINGVRDKYIALQQNYSEILVQEVLLGFEKLTDIYKAERPFRYYLVTPLLFVKKFIVNSGSYYLPIHSTNPCFSIYQMAIKLWTSGLYWCTLLMGLAGSFLLLKHYSRYWIIIYIPLMIVVLFPIVFRSVEWRMFEPMFSMFLILSLVTFSRAMTWVSRGKTKM